MTAKKKCSMDEFSEVKGSFLRPEVETIIMKEILDFKLGIMIIP